MVKGLISRLDLVTCAVKHTTLLTSQHWTTRSRTRNPLHCVPLLHPTVTGTTVPYLYLQHSLASYSYSTAWRSCSHVTSVSNVPVWSQEEGAIWSAPGGMSEVRLWCRCCLVAGCWCWCWAGAWVTVSQMETKKRNICAVSGPRPPLTRVKIFSVHPVKIFSVHCVRPAAMCLVQNMCNNLALVTTISKHSAQKTDYWAPATHIHRLVWYSYSFHPYNKGHRCDVIISIYLDHWSFWVDIKTWKKLGRLYSVFIILIMFGNKQNEKCIFTSSAPKNVICI